MAARSSAPAANSTYYPAFLDLRGRRVVVLGGGSVAARKVADLALAGADIVVVAPQADASTVRLAAEGALAWRQRPYQETDLDGAFMLVAATDSRATNARAAQEARRRGVLVNAVDDPANCDVIAPAVVRRGDLAVAISTNGASPAVARYVREALETVLGDEYGELLAVAAEARGMVVARGLSVAPERWQSGLAVAMDALRAGAGLAEARARLLACLGVSSAVEAESPEPVRA